MPVDRTPMETFQFFLLYHNLLCTLYSRDVYSIYLFYLFLFISLASSEFLTDSFMDTLWPQMVTSVDRGTGDGVHIVIYHNYVISAILGYVV